MGKPTFIFVHGAWHPSSCWDQVIAQLSPKGYKCIAPQVLFCGTSEPISKIQPCIDQVSDIVSAETSAGNDVVLVGHSFGGISASSAAKGFTAQDPSKLTSKAAGKVVGVALMCAMVVPTDSSFGATYAQGEPSHTIIAAPRDDGWCDLTVKPQDAFYADIPTEDAEKWAASLKKQSFGCMLDSDGVYAGWLDVPLWYLLCEKDAVFTVAFQERMIDVAKDAGSKVEVKRVDAGHSPFLSRVGETAKFLVGAAEAMSS